MRSSLWIPLLLIPAFAQSPADLFHKAPPEVEEALVARVKAFYQCHVDNKFRQAEEYVADDTKDYFYTAAKPHFFSFEIKSIKWGADYKTAEVTVTTERTLPIIGMSDKPVKFPEVSRWKIDNGKWSWYVPSAATNMTPFGPIKGGDKPSNRPAGMPRQMPSVDQAVKDLDRVKVDRNSVQLGKAPERVTIKNSLTGPVNLTLTAPKVDALTLSLDRQEIKSGEQAVLTITPVSGKKPPNGPVNISIFIKETGRDIPIQIKF